LLMLYGRFDSNVDLDLHSKQMMRGGLSHGMAQVISRLMHIWMISWIFQCLFSSWCPGIVDSARSALDAVREGFMAISNLLDIDSISDTPISNLVVFDPTWRAPPLGLLLARSSDLGNAVFASTRGPTPLDKDCSLSFAKCYLTSVHVRPAQRIEVPLADSHLRSRNLMG
jgi:hypothetical protein